VLARQGDVLHAFLRDPAKPSNLVAHGLDADDVRHLVEQMAGGRREE
jgi:hypothetical protein